ncbi:MAG: energy transducer TonB [Melioribacteraceae bacterium]|nr:energy transducer TonB [Melioribacteraceae bacterium]
MLIQKILRYTLLYFIISPLYFAQDGFVYTYYSSGEVEGVIFYASDVLEGTSYWYHQNGNLKAERTYSNGRLNGLAKEFYDTGLMKSEISIKYGVRDGLSKYYYENGALEKILSYENGALIKEVKIENDPFYVAPLDAYKYANTQERIKDNEDLFLCGGADICPKPVGGMDEIIKHLVFPEHAKLYGLEGFVTVVVTVNTFGLVEDVVVLNDLGLGTKEAAIDAVKASRFLPGEKDGETVKSKVLFKIPFLLNSKILYAAASPKDRVNVGTESSNIVVKDKAEIKIDTDTLSSSKNIEDKPIPASFTCSLDVCAKPKDGIKSVLENFVMPSVVKRKGLEGEVIVEATVDIYGNVRDTKVLSGLGYGCDIAVEVAILQTKFEPGLQNGEPIKSIVKIKVPIVQQKVKEMDKF